MSGGSDFTVDTATLAALITRMGQCEDTLETLTNEVEATVAKMHNTWTGEAAVAQRAAHARWEQGLHTMREALADLKTKSHTAQSNYESAGDANLQMWQDAQ